MAGLRFSCPNCGQHLEAPEAAAGCPVACPSCQTQFRVPSASTLPSVVAAAPSGAAGPVCAYCQSILAADEPKTACPACQAEYHAECWQENGGCAIYGCSQVPEIEQRRSIEIPISHWGMENKPCPACGREILAAAVRCRFCGATFSSAQPEDAGTFQERAAFKERQPARQKTIVWLFVFSVVPCLAPIGAVWGLVWYPRNRREVEALPGMFPALCKIGLGVALSQCVVIVLAALAYGALRIH
jgi:hypothetical protein